MKLTGRDIHHAYYVVCSHSTTKKWEDLQIVAQQKYDDMAYELNKALEQDAVTIEAVRCPNCNEMLPSEHCEGHACWLLEGKR